MIYLLVNKRTTHTIRNKTKCLFNLFLSLSLLLFFKTVSIFSLLYLFFVFSPFSLCYCFGMNSKSFYPYRLFPISLSPLRKGKRFSLIWKKYNIFDDCKTSLTHFLCLAFLIYRTKKYLKKINQRTTKNVFPCKKISP
jgi:hypothetical protein